MLTVLVRASQIGLITGKQMGQQIGVLNKNYGKDYEPIELSKPLGCTRLNRLVFAALVDEQITVSRAAEIMGVPLVRMREDLMQWMEGAPCNG